MRPLLPPLRPIVPVVNTVTRLRGRRHAPDQERGLPHVHVHVLFHVGPTALDGRHALVVIHLFLTAPDADDDEIT